MSESKEYYKALAEAREFNLDTVLKPSMEILHIRGIVLSMIGDVVLYAVKNGKNEKYHGSMSKLTAIDEFLNS